MDGYMTTEQAAEYLGYTADYVTTLCATGKLPGAKKWGKRMWIIPEQSVFDYKPGPQGFAAVKARKLAAAEELRRLLNAACKMAQCEVQAQ